MTVPQNRIQLSRTQADYLQRSSFLPASLAQIVETAESEGGEALVIHISREVTEEFRSAFTEQLATAGFAADYEPTGEGRILEELIDRFYLGDGG